MNEGTGDIPVRAINEAGIDRLRRLLESVRKGENKNQDLSALVSDPEYTTEIDGAGALPAAPDFSTQANMISTFRERLGDSFLAEHRKDRGFWTWVAVLYQDKLLKETRKPGTEACWIYAPDNYREFRRHYFAGTVYLHQDFEKCCPEAKEILFSGKLTGFGAMRDAITYNPEVARTPAVMEVVAWLYHDPTSQKRYKPGSATQDRAGTIRDLLHVVGHFAKTQDFHGVEDAPFLWRILPEQFGKFKGGAVH